MGLVQLRHAFFALGGFRCLFLYFAVYTCVLFVALGFWLQESTTGWSLYGRNKNAFAQIDVQLKRRYDLIPNLVETAKGYVS